jgi:hypothetical protein
MLAVGKHKHHISGTTPLVTISAKESNSKPSGPETFNNRAKPSKNLKDSKTYKIKSHFEI